MRALVPLALAALLVANLLTGHLPPAVVVADALVATILVVIGAMLANGDVGETAS